MPERYTARYQLRHFEDGELYEIEADHFRFQAIENQIEAFMSVVKGGVIRGWEAVEGDNALEVQVTSGIGIIPFKVREVLIENVETSPGKIEYVDKIDKIFSNQEVTKYLGVRTNITSDPITLPPNTISLLYIGLSEAVVDVLQDPDKAEVQIDLSASTSLQFYNTPDPSAPPGTSGPYRNTTPLAGTSGALEYPIYRYQIEGVFNDRDNDATIFVNGKPYYEKYVIEGKTITFDWPLSLSDVVTVRVEPKFSLILAEVETDNSGITRIDNSVRPKIFEIEQDSIVHSALLEHVHNALEGSPEKILLTTETRLITYSSAIGNKIYTFEKQPIIDTYSFNFGYIGSSALLNYEPIVYVNGVRNTDPVTVLDTGSQIQVTFTESLEDSDTVQLVLRIKDDFTQIQGKLIINDANPSAEQKEISFDASTVTEGLLDPNMIPTFSHIGVSREALKPTNPVDGNEYVHRGETRDYQEFFPILLQKANARDAKDLFAVPKNTSEKRVYACGSSTALYYNAVLGKLVGDKPEEFFTGWSVLDFDRVIGAGGNDTGFNEFGNPFRVLPFKRNAGSNAYDEIFYFSQNFIYSVKFVAGEPEVSEIANLSSDKVTSETDFDSLVSEIQFAVPAVGLLNVETSVIVAASDQVFLADSKNGRINWWSLTTNNPLWDSIDSLTNLYEEYSEVGSDVLFVGAQESSDNKLYVNPMGYALLRNRANSSINGGLNLNNFSIQDSDVWDFTTDEKSLFRSSTETISDGLILTTYNGVSERLTASIVNYTDSETPASNTIFFSTDSGITQDYEGFGTKYNSFFMRDWTLIAENLASSVVKVFYFNSRLFILCEDTLYFTNDEYLPEESHYLCNQITTPLTPADLSTVSLTLGSGETYTDAIVVGTEVLVGTTQGIYKLNQTLSFPLSYSLLTSVNGLYGTSLNELLYPVNAFKKAADIVDNENAVFVLTKYGIFYSGDAGETWRNTIQILGRPEDTSSPYSVPKGLVRVVSVDESQNRIYITKSENIYAYGYGYGYLPAAGINYFDIISLESSNYGFSESNFFDLIYGYGYGFELLNPITGVVAGDWLYTIENSGNIYDDVPIRIAGVGLDTSVNQYYVDIEQSDGNPIDFTAIFRSQVFRIYPKIDALALIDGIPQNSLYDSTDIEAYTEDYYRQSIEFDSELDEDKDVTIASQYKAFTIIDSFDTSLITDSNSTLDLNKLDLTRNTEWTFDSDNTLIETTYGFNLRDVLRLTVRGVFVTDIGEYDHDYIEDQLSLEATGLEYKFDGVRTSNFLLFMMSVQHLFLNEPYTLTVLHEGTVDFVLDPSGTSNGFIQDSTLTFDEDELLGNDIILNSGSETRRFTIVGNSATLDRIYVQRRIEYEDLSSQADGTDTFTFAKDSAISGSVLVYVDGLPVVAFTEILSGIYAIGIQFTVAPSAGARVQVAYSPRQTNLLLSDLVSPGDSYQVVEEDSGPYAFLENTFISRYRDESEFIIDETNSFIENDILFENIDIGESIDALFAVHYNASTDTLYAGTNKGIWRRSLDDIIYEKTSELLPTLDPTGTIAVPNQINGAYVQYDKDTKEWTISWGGGTVSKDGNLDLDKIKVTAVSVSPLDPNIAFFATTDRIFRTFDGGLTFEVIYHIAADSDLDEYPECVRLVPDTKNPWVVVAVFRNKVLKSLDYGSNWFDISGTDIGTIGDGGVSAFSYQKSDSDASSFYYFGRNNLFVEEYQNRSPISYRNESHRRSRKIERRYLFGPDFVDAVFTGIDNYKEDQDVVYLGMRNYGVYKTTILGNSQNFTLSVYRLRYGYGEVASFLNDYTNGDTKTCAFNDVEGTPFSYDIYVDNENNKTYVSFQILPTERTVPADGDFVGKYVRIFGADRSFMRILEHYERGPAPSLQGVFGPDGTYYERKLVEFVLEGKYPKKYSGSSTPRFVELANGDYYYETGELTSGSVFFLSTIDIPVFAPSNGRVDKIPLVDLEDNVYITKSNVFNGAEKETTAFIDLAPDSLVGQDLAGYYIGDKQSNTRYKILESKVLDASDVYYLGDLYGYGYGYGYGAGFDYFDIIGLAEYLGYGYPLGYGVGGFEATFSGTYGSGWGFALTPYAIGEQIALRLEKIEGGGDDFEFDYREDPINIFHRYQFTELHYRGSDETIAIVDDNDNFLTFANNIENDTKVDVYVEKRDVFTPGHDQNVIVFRVKPEFYFDFLDFEDALVGKYVQNLSTGNKHLIYGSRVIESGDPDYDASVASLYLRVEAYGSSKIKNATLFSDGTLSAVSSNSVTLERSAGLESNALENLGLYFDNGSIRNFRVVSNTGDTIVVDSTIIDQIAVPGTNLANISGQILFADVLDLIVHQDTGNVYVATFDGVFYSSDQGRFWRKAFEGLEQDETTNIPFPQFSQITISENYLYAVSETALYEGVYRLNLSTHAWEQIGGLEADVLNRVDCLSLSVYEDSNQIVVYVGTEENALYKGTYLKASPGWTWVHYSLNSVTAVDAIANHDDLADVDRIWVGTKDRGLFVRDEDQDDWVSFTEFSNIETEITADRWRVWDVGTDSGLIAVSNLKRTIDIYSRADLVEDNYVQDSSDTVFDWVYVNQNTNEGSLIHLYSQDPFNNTYLTQEVSATTTSQESRGSHRFFNFATGISGSEGLYDFETMLNGYSVFNYVVGYDNVSMYESPIIHLPEFSSVHVIEETPGGNVILGTDRSGLFRTKSSNQQFIMPAPTGNAAKTNYGFTFIGNNFEDVVIPRLDYFKSYDGRNNVDNRFTYIWERVFSYTIIEGVPNNGFTQINNLDDYTDLVGAYMVFTRGDVTEVNGSDSIRVYVIDAISFVSDGIQPDKYVITLSAGRLETYSKAPATRAQWGDIYDRWSSDSLPTDVASGVSTRFYIVDFERFEAINSGLPTVAVKNEKGQDEIAAMIRGISIDSSDNSASIACGLGGVYTCSDIDAENVVWIKESDLPEMDVTSIVRNNGDIFIGTWGDGVWSDRSGSWANLDSEMEHPYIWTLFLNAAEDTIFIGTEHGGIYTLSPLNSGVPVRETEKGVIRSQIYLWRTVGVPVRKSSGIDYSDGNLLVSYAWGGGIMQSTDGGANWNQINTGLENFYVQDIAIAPDNSSVAYAATYGGGVFKTTNLFSSKPEWHRCTREGLPSTLNVDEVAVGTNTNVLYVKARENDLSFRHVPYRYRGNYTRSSLFPSNSLGFGFLDFAQIDGGELIDSNGKFLPLTPHSDGTRKHTVYRSVDGGISWTKVYDKEPITDNDYTMSSIIYGLEMVPGEDDTVQFLSKYTFDVNLGNSNREFVSRFDYVTIADGVISSEIQIPANFELTNSYWGGLGDITNYGDAYISINPEDSSEVFLTIHNSSGRGGIGPNGPIVLRSTDSGQNWDYRISHRVRPGFTRFTSAVQFSTKDAFTEDVVLNGTNLLSATATTLTGVFNEDDANRPTYFWPRAQDLLLNTDDYPYASIRFDDANLFFHTSPEQPVNISTGIRPFYLNGAQLRPDSGNQTDSGLYTVTGGGHSTFLPSEANRTTFLIDREYVRNSQIQQTVSTLSNLTSLLFDYDELSADSLLRQEDSLIGLDVAFSSDNYATTYKVAIQRYYESGGNRMQLVLIGTPTVSAGMTMRIYPEKPIFVPMYENVMVSYNKGLSWKHAASESDFASAATEILGIVSFPKEYMTDASLANVDRRLYILTRKNGVSKLFYGDVSDDRYGSGTSLDDIDWTEISLGGSNTKDYLPGGIALSITASAQYVYLTQRNRISRLQVNNGVPSGSPSTVYGDTDPNAGFNIKYPLVVSEVEPDKMYFVDNNSLKYTSDNFTNAPLTYTLPRAIRGEAVQDIQPSDSTNAPDSLFLSVNTGQSLETIATTYNDVLESFEDNINILGIRQSPNPFLESPKWVGKIVSFEDSSNGTPLEYTSRIVQVLENEINLLPSLRGEITAASYDTILNKTTVTFVVDREIFDFTEADDYRGTIFTIQQIRNSESSIYEGRVEDLDLVDDLTFNIIITGDMETFFGDRNIDFISVPAYIRVGRLLDFLQPRSSGVVVSSRISDLSENNGLYSSLTNGNGWTRLDSIFYDENDRPAGIKLYGYESEIGETQTKTAIVTSNGITRVLVNDGWFASQNFQSIEIASDDSVFAATDNGLVSISLNTLDPDQLVFDNYYFNDFESIFALSADSFIISDNDGNTYITDKPEFDFFGNETLTPTSFKIPKINKAQSDSYGLIWIATNQGLYVINGTDVTVFNEDNSDLASNTVEDLKIDGFQRLWLCLGEDGIAVIDYSFDSELNISSWVTYDESAGFSGSIQSVVEKSGLGFIYDGLNSPATATLNWTNNTILTPRSMLIRSRTSQVPSVQSKSFIFSPITGQIGSVEEEEISGVTYWKITASTLDNIGTGNIVENSFAGKKILINSRENDEVRTIVLNSLNEFYIVKNDSEDAPEASKYFMVAEGIDGFDDTYVLYTDTTSAPSTSLNYIDSHLVEGQEYYYHLFFFAAGSTSYNRIESKPVTVVDGEQAGENSNLLLFVGPSGVFSYNPQQTVSAQPFASIGNLGVVSEIRSAFIDSSRVVWIAADNRVIRFVSSDQVTSFDKDDLFSDNDNVSSANMEPYDFAENSEGDLFIGTNIGLVVIKSDDRTISYVENDEKRVANDSVWRPVLILEDEAQGAIFLDGDQEGRQFAIIGDFAYYTDNKGLSWTLADENLSVQYADEVLDASSNVVDYVFIQNSQIFSSLDSDISDGDLINIVENIPDVSGSNSTSIPGHIHLLETDSDQKILAGLFNNNIIANEREIAVLDVSSVNELQTPTYIGDSNGLSIQSIYSFSEISSVGMFAGGKDCVYYREAGSSDWAPIPMLVDNLNAPYWAYTGLEARADSGGSFAFGTTADDKVVVYATRSDLYASYLGRSDYYDSNVVTLRFKESNLYNNEGGYSPEATIFFGGNHREILWVDDKSLDNYYIHPILSLRKSNLDGHRGAIKFIDGKKTLLVGGFQNSLYILPFTAEAVTPRVKRHVSVPARRVNFAESDLPQYSYDQYFGSLSSNEKSYGTFRLRPSAGWNVSWNNDNDQEGYCNFTLLGQNLNNPKVYYEYASEENVSWAMKTKDGGHFWYHFPKDGYPNGIVANMVVDNVETAIAVIGGSDVGVYRFDSVLDQWTEYYAQSIPKVPVKVMVRSGADIFAGPLGFGLYRMARGVGGYGYGYGGSETLDYFDIISQPGTSYGFVQGYADGTYTYGYGYEVVEEWSKFAARHRTESGFGLAGWHVTSISEDPTNKNRVVVGTKDNGAFEGVFDGTQWVWKTIDAGISAGSISVIKLLNTDPFTIFAGVNDSGSENGMYIRRSGETSFTKVEDLGLPNTGVVTDIQIDTNVSDVYTSFFYTNTVSPAANLVILRSAFESPSAAPDDGIRYQKGSQVANAEVIYVGTEDFSSDAFIDDDKSLRPGVPYYYRFFQEDGLEYQEIDAITGTTSAVNATDIILGTSALSGEDRVGNICRIFNPLNGIGFSFKIQSHTDNQIFFEADPFGIINRGTTGVLEIESYIDYTVQSTIVAVAVVSNPVYIVMDGDVYLTIDNGRSWVLRSTGLDVDVNSVTPVIQTNVLESTVLSTTLYAAAVDGVFKSENSGNSWTRISEDVGVGYNGLPNDKNYIRVWIDPNEANIVYALEETGEIYRTVNDGELWELVISSENETLNASDYVPDNTNIIYLGFDDIGLQRFADSIRDTLYVEIEANGRITEFDIDYFEMGDKFYTDSNSILATTIVKNDLVTDTREQVRMKVSDDTDLITFKFRKNNSLIDFEDIYVGDINTNPYTNPFTLANPAYDQDNIVINRIGNITEEEVFAITNKGLYTSTDQGDRWVKENSAVVPSNIFDVGVARDGEILLGTEGKGLWTSVGSRSLYRNVEQDGADVRTVWETRVGGNRRVFRGGTRGLYVTSEKPSSRSIIVYSGPTFGGGKSIEFSWGDLLNPNDGGWSDSTIRSLDIPIFAFRQPGGQLQTYDGWDEALIVRRGPYATLEKAQNDALSNDVFAPINRVQYPYNRAVDTDRIFRTSSSSNLEEIRDINEIGDGAVGVSLDPPAFMSDGNIVIGVFKNTSNEYPATDPNYPTTDDPIIDRVDPSLIDADIRAANGMPVENFADADAYDLGEERLPILKEDRFYIYRIYPYRNVPSPDFVKGIGDNVFFPLHPRYYPSTGDLVDSYSYTVDIKKFSGASNIISVSANIDGNWIVGTDVGVFWTTQEGADVVQSLVIQRETPSVFVSSAGLTIVAVVGSTRLEVYSNSKDLTDSTFDSSWTFLTDLVSVFQSSGVNRVYGFDEDENGVIYAATNKGIFEGNSDGTNWVRSDSVGDLESVRSGKAIGQEFVIES